MIVIATVFTQLDERLIDTMMSVRMSPRETYYAAAGRALDQAQVELDDPEFVACFFINPSGEVVGFECEAGLMKQMPDARERQHYLKQAQFAAKVRAKQEAMTAKGGAA